jgi:sodium transport system permease protein
VNFLQRQDMKLLDPKPDFRELIKQGNHDAVMVIPADFSEKFLTGEAKVELVYDDTRQSSSGASVGVLRRVMRAFNAEVSAQRLIARGIAPTLLRPVEVQDTNLGTAAQRAAGLLFIIPWITLIGCVTGCTAMAVDLAAGERERGSLEPLLMTPVGRDALVLGKGVAVSIYSLGIAVLTLIGFALTLKYGNLPAIGSVLSLSAAQYGMFFLMLLTFAPAMAAIQMLLATYHLAGGGDVRPVEGRDLATVCAGAGATDGHHTPAARRNHRSHALSATRSRQCRHLRCCNGSHRAVVAAGENHFRAGLTNLPGSFPFSNIHN